MLKTFLNTIALLLSLLMGGCGIGPIRCFAQQPAKTFRVPSVNNMVLLDATVNDKPASPLLDTSPVKVEAPKPKTDRKVFIVGVSLLAASNVTDAITTRQGLDRGAWENNPVFGRHPSPAKQAAVNAALFAGQVLAFHFTERSRRPWLRWLGRVGVGLQTEEHARLAACNVGLGVRGSCWL